METFSRETCSSLWIMSTCNPRTRCVKREMCKPGQSRRQCRGWTANKTSGRLDIFVLRSRWRPLPSMRKASRLNYPTWVAVSTSSGGRPLFIDVYLRFKQHTSLRTRQQSPLRLSDFGLPSWFLPAPSIKPLISGVLAALFLSSSLDNRSSVYQAPSLKMTTISSLLLPGSAPYPMSFLRTGRRRRSISLAGSYLIVSLEGLRKTENRSCWSRRPWRTGSIRHARILMRRKAAKSRR